MVELGRLGTSTTIQIYYSGGKVSENSTFVHAFPYLGVFESWNLNAENKLKKREYSCVPAAHSMPCMFFVKQKYVFLFLSAG